MNWSPISTCRSTNSVTSSFECDLLAPFIDAGKPVFNAEYKRSYVDNPSDLCNQADAEQIRVLVLPLDLDDAFRITCD